jgi:ribonucleoside-diphosphate reductase alpha chain
MEKRIKGLTIFRDNCKRLGILTINKPENKEDSVQLEADHFSLPRGYIVKADDRCIGLKRTLTTGCGTLHCTAYFDPITGELRETYLSKGSKGGCANFMVGLSRMISLAARGGLGIDAIIDQLNSCGVCPSYAVRTATKRDTSKGACCPTAVGIALKEMYEEVQNRIQRCVPEEYTQETTVNLPEYEECPECHQKGLTRIGGCNQCVLCGFSKCE